MTPIMMKLELYESIKKEGDDRTTPTQFLMFKSIKYDITFKVLTDKVRHRLDEPISLDTLIELYIEIPKFIKENQRR